MPKVLGIVSFRVFPTHMGGQKGVALFYRYLSQYLPVILASSNDNRDSGKLQQESLLYPNRSIYRNIGKLSAMKQMIARHAVDVIIAEHSYAGWMAWWLYRRTGKPFIIHSHNIETSRFRQMHKKWWPLYGWYEGWVHRRAQHNFFISHEDREAAIALFHLDARRCSVITYGVERMPLAGDKKTLRNSLGLEADTTILLFNGTLDYSPNYDAVVLLANTIEPLLRKSMKNFRIIITGNRAPASLISIIQSNPNLHYEGYVEHVHLYYQAADLFLNPIANDTGVKTKLIEAVANNCTAISTVAGASGIDRSVCGEKIITVADKDWDNFAGQVLSHAGKATVDTPPEFYEAYAWDRITARAAEIIKELSNP